jgi:hypothetical protein
MLLSVDLCLHQLLTILKHKVAAHKLEVIIYHVFEPMKTILKLHKSSVGHPIHCRYPEALANTDSMRWR